VSASGLTLSEGKTMTDARYFSLNSTLFKGCQKRQRLVPFVRSKTLFGIGEEDSIASLRGRFHSFVVGYGSGPRSRARVIFLRENSGWISKSCRSLTRGLGIQVEPEVLVKAGMWSRELRYLATSEKPLPNLTGEWAHMPDGYHLRWVDKDTKRSRSRDKLLQAEFIEAAWRPRNDDVSWKTRDEVFCFGLNLADSVIVRNKQWTTRMVKLGSTFLEKIYGRDDGIRDWYRWIKTRWTKVDPSLFRKFPKVYPCWFADNEKKPLSLVSDSNSIDVLALKLTEASLRLSEEDVVKEKTEDDLRKIVWPANRSYRSVPPPFVGREMD